MESCSKISSLQLMNIEKNRVYMEGEFKVAQSERFKSAVAELAALHSEIQDLLVSLHTFFTNDPTPIQARWMKFLSQVDDKIEAALRTCIKR